MKMVERIRLDCARPSPFGAGMLNSNHRPIAGPSPGIMKAAYVNKPRKTGASKNEKKDKPPTNRPFKERFPSRPSAAARILSTNVKTLRKELDLSQAELAEKVGVDQAVVGLIELKRSNPTLQTIAALAKALETSIADLLSKAARHRSPK
jgi:DNA-binding XRE family transcriptional regulator